MILIRNSNPTPRAIWLLLYRIARTSNNQHYAIRNNELRVYTDWLQSRYNIDSDYLMETMGKYALSIT